MKEVLLKATNQSTRQGKKLCKMSLCICVKRGRLFLKLIRSLQYIFTRIIPVISHPKVFFKARGHNCASVIKTGPTFSHLYICCSSRCAHFRT